MLLYCCVWLIQRGDNVVSITVSVPLEVKLQMDNFSEINWSGLIRKTIIEKTKELTWKEEMLKKLGKEKDFEDWTIEMGRKLKSNAGRRD